jgi:hypothetical protein
VPESIYDVSLFTSREYPSTNSSFVFDSFWTGVVASSRHGWSKCQSNLITRAIPIKISVPDLSTATSRHYHARLGFVDALNEKKLILEQYSQDFLDSHRRIALIFSAKVHETQKS